MACGSCLCGGVSWESTGEAAMMSHCHCSRCRKARGVAHASNLFGGGNQLRWLRGEALLDSYKVPEAERFIHCFCRVCGSSMPRSWPDRVMVPAGSLDDDPGARERMHIFVGSRAPWYEIPGDLPQFDEYPPSQS